MLRLLSCLLIVVIATTAAAEEEITQADLLKRMINLQRLIIPPAEGEVSGMFTSYDRRSQIDPNGALLHWDANGDAGNFLRTRDDGWQVMAEIDGPGVITRIWSANPHGQLRIVLDGEVVVDRPFGDFMTDEQYVLSLPNGQGGATLYFPIGFNERCEFLLKDGGPYYHICYLKLPGDKTVQTFSPELDAEARQAAGALRMIFVTGLPPAYIRQAQAHTENRRMTPELKPGDKLRLDMPGRGILRRLRVEAQAEPNTLTAEALHQCVLRIWFDGDETPSVEVPLVDFFGSGFAPLQFESLLTRVVPAQPEPGTGQQPPEHLWWLESFFPMPYADGFTIEIENLSRRTIEHCAIRVNVDAAIFGPEVLRFHAGHRMIDPADVLDVPVLEAPGPGRFVGFLLNIDCPRETWWGEGDEKVWLDGEEFPSYFGTGTEDTFNDAWGLHQHTQPFHAATRASGLGRSSMFRWYVPDEILFRDSIRYTIENWQHGRAWDTYYGTIAYWYGPAGGLPRDFFPPLTRADLQVPALRLPNAQEAETTLVEDSEVAGVATSGELNTRLSGNRGVRLAADRAVRFRLRSEAARAAKLLVRVPPLTSFERLRAVQADGRVIGEVAGRAGVDTYELGVVRLNEGETPITVTADAGIIIDAWRLRPVGRIGGGYEAEELEREVDPGAAAEIEWATLDWFAGAQLACELDEGTGVRLMLPKREETGAVAPRLHLTRGPGGGRIQVTLNGEPQGDPLVLAAEQRQKHVVLLPNVTIPAGEHTLGFTAVSGPATFGIDAIQFVPVADPNALEGERLPILDEYNSHHTIQPIGGASAEGHRWCRPEEPGAWIELGVPVGQAGRYRVTVTYTTSFDYGIVQASVNGEPLGEPVDTFGELKPGKPTVLGEVELEAGVAPLRFTVMDTNTRSGGYYFGIDYVKLERVE